MDITEKQVKLIKALFDTFWKSIYSLVFTAVFISILGLLLYFCFNSGSNTIKIALGSIEALLTGTLFVVIKHYFPTQKKKRKRLETAR